MRSNRTLYYFGKFIRQLPHLSIREKEVIICRLRNTTLEKIGQKLGLTEGRIRQIEKQALLKVKSKKQQLQLFKKLV